MNVIYTFTNRQGIGDNLRGLISLLQIQKKIQKKIIIHVDFSRSLIHKYLSHQLPSQFENSDEIKEFGYGDECSHDNEIIHYLNSHTNTVRVNSNAFPDINNITEEMKIFIRNIFEFTPEFEDTLNTYYAKIPKDYDIYHYRFGDDIFSNDNANCDANLKSFKDSAGDRNCLVLSDSFNFKKKIYDIYNNNTAYVFLNKPNHTCCVTDDPMDIFIDFFLVTKAKTIYCYNYYGWVSNFVLWHSYIYNIPIVDLKKI